MPLEVIIDGYNLLNGSPSLGFSQSEHLESARNRLIEKLDKYKRQKNVTITVVFDGWKGGSVTQSRDIMRGIKIIYSKLGEKADEVIKRMVTNPSIEMVVVSSDREIRNFAESNNIMSISSTEFDQKLEMASYFEMKGCYDQDDDYKETKATTNKKGNPKKLPKSERKRRAKLKKL